MRRAQRAINHRRAEARMSLGYGPYLTARARCEVTAAVGGACTKVRRHYLKPTAHTWAAPRGKVREFSRRSRTRLMQTMCALPIKHVGRGVLFVTLTYPAAYPGEWSTWKRQLDTFLKRVRRRLPAAGGVWKLEPQKRGAPHYHLLIVGVPFIAKAWLTEAWRAAIKTDDEWHRVYGVWVELARSHRGVIAYAAKYTAKHQELPASWAEGVGRWWGVFGRAQLGITWINAPLTQSEYFAFARVLRELVARRSKHLGRGPPRANASGTWAVLSDTDALRIGVTVQGADWRPLPHRRRLGVSDGCARDTLRIYP